MPHASLPRRRPAALLLLAAVLAASAAVPLRAQPTEYVVTTPFELTSALRAVGPGDVVTMADGRWTDVAVVFDADGVEGDSIRLRAETPGQVILDGASYLRIGGDYLVVDGLRFEGGSPAKGAVIEFRTSGYDQARHSRLTNTAIVDYNPPVRTTDYKWVSLYGTYNRVDHSYFAGKNHDGTTLVVWLEDGERAQPNYHRIDHNHFGPRPPLGRNGGETIRIGTSDRSMQNSRTTVEYNLFERCDGESEIISNKSGENVFRYNTFRGSRGALTLRHGNRARVEGNVFFGEGRTGTGGVRVVGEDHVVVNNHFVGLQGSGYQSALSLMNGVPDSPLNRYFQVKRPLVAFNTFAQCRNPLLLGAGADSEKTLPPEDVVFANNVILSGSGVQVVRVDDAPASMTWEGTVVWGGTLGLDDPGGIAFVDPLLAEGPAGLWRPLDGSPLLDAALGAYPTVALDADAQPRADGAPDVGADERSAAPVEARPLTAADVGPAWRTATGVAPAPDEQPDALRLGAAYPNPVRTRVTLPVTLPEAARVVVTVYDVLGREVATAADRWLPAGPHRLAWTPGPLASGPYLAVVRAGGRTGRVPLVLAR